MTTNDIHLIGRQVSLSFYCTFLFWLSPQVTTMEMCLEIPLVMEYMVVKVQDAFVLIYDYYETRKTTVTIIFIKIIKQKKQHTLHRYWNCVPEPSTYNLFVLCLTRETYSEVLYISSQTWHVRVLILRRWLQWMQSTGEFYFWQRTTLQPSSPNGHFRIYSSYLPSFWWVKSIDAG